MIYSVSARLAAERSGEFHAKLTDGSIAGQKPDGAEIVAAMARARIGGDCVVRWTETCYCASPLAHERATVLDCYFTDIETEITEAHAEFDGAPLMTRLAEVVAGEA
jgi:hypothetical protein